MAFPNVIYGRYGDEKVAQSTKIGGLPLGQKMVLPDGREFRHSCAQTAAALVAGKLVMAGSAIADHGCGTADQMAGTVTAIGATSLIVKPGGSTAIGAAYYADGEMLVRDGTGEGLHYKVKTNNSAATGASCTVGLQDTDGLIVALDATSRITLRRNPYFDLLTKTADTVYTGPIVGVPVVAVSAGFYCWIQGKGLGPGFQSAATLAVIGSQVLANTGVAGAFQAAVAAATATPNLEKQLGQVHVANTASVHTLVDWNI